MLEGGPIHVDGQGILLTIRECLLNPNRNPGLSMGEIEETLRQNLGVEKILWLEKGNLLIRPPAIRDSLKPQGAMETTGT